MGKSIELQLTDCLGQEIPQSELYIPHYRKNREIYGSRLICNGCSDCGRCKECRNKHFLLNKNRCRGGGALCTKMQVYVD